MLHKCLTGVVYNQRLEGRNTCVFLFDRKCGNSTKEGCQQTVGPITRPQACMSSQSLCEDHLGYSFTRSPGLDIQHPERKKVKANLGQRAREGSVSHGMKLQAYSASCRPSIEKNYGETRIEINSAEASITSTTEESPFEKPGSISTGVAINYAARAGQCIYCICLYSHLSLRSSFCFTRLPSLFNLGFVNQHSKAGDRDSIITQTRLPGRKLKLVYPVVTSLGKYEPVTLKCNVTGILISMIF